VSYEPSDDPKDYNPPLPPATARDLAKALNLLIDGFRSAIDRLDEFARELEQQGKRQ
jgi:hypothetical protein